MEQNFSLMAQSRANYYTAGSPVQFVRVELLKGDVNGEIAVCLTFKNIAHEPLTGLVIHFKCKDPSGRILCEDDFYYEQLNAQPGELFGSDDAVYVSDTPVSSVEIEQDRAFLSGRGVDLRAYKRVRLQTPRVLPGSIARTLQSATGNAALVGVPQDTQYGWFCACGAFHPNEENASVCSECGADRTYIKKTLTQILEQARQAAERQQREINAAVDPAAAAAATAAAAQRAIAREEAEPAPAASRAPYYNPAPAQQSPYGAAQQPYAPQPTQRPLPYAVPKPTYSEPAPAPAAPQYAEPDEEAERVQRFAPGGRLFADEDSEEYTEENTRMFDADEDDYTEEDAPSRGRYADDEEDSDEDVVAERIIRLAPPITGVICALIVALSLVYHFVIA